MQRHPSNESKIAIPPNLLKNFNVYDILEPEKNGAKNSDATKVDKLIDIDDCSRDSGFQDSDLNPALFDKNRDFDLVDLYQNIFVTPQHIKKKGETEEVDATFSASKVVDDGFKQFFDMLESGQKIDWTNSAQSKEESAAKHDFLEKKPRVLVPKVFMEPDSDSEDIINEILTQKNIERLVLGHTNNSRNSSDSQDRESPEKLKNPDVIPEISRLNLNGLNKDSNLESGSFKNILRPSEIELSPLNSQINNCLPNFIVRAIQKDEKVYKKKRVQKPESQTVNFTKGPDFYEKSVVLPQIMARLYARLEYLDAKANQKKRLILDAGVPPVKTESTTSNANGQIKTRPNNQALSTTPTAKEQIKTKPNNICNISKNEVATKKPNNTSGINSLKGNVKIKEEANLCISKVTNNIRVHVTDKPCPNCSKPSTTKQTNNPGGTSTKTGYGELSPVVLMEDCNKERLRALKQSQMFKDFVLKGKYEL